MEEFCATQDFAAQSCSQPFSDDDEPASSQQDVVCTLVRQGDYDQEAEIRADELLAIGRSHEEPEGGGGLLVLDDPLRNPPAVSNKHALLRPSGGKLALEILSANGYTFVNEQPHIVKKKRGVGTLISVPIFDGDMLRFGGGITENDRYDKFVFRVVAPTVVRPSAPAEQTRSRPDFVWQWQNRAAASEWTSYSEQHGAIIERAYQMHEPRVRLDPERVLDLCQMRQVRDDNPGRSRAVRREPAVSPLPDMSPRKRKRRLTPTAVDGGDASTPSTSSPGTSADGGRGQGGGTSAADQCTVRVLPSLAPAKRATMRICTLRRKGSDPPRWSVLTAGSGCLVSRDGHILTAAHLFINTRSGALFNGVPADEVLIAVAVYETDAAPSKWAWWADLLTPIELLTERDASKRLLDLAVLRIRGALTLSPPLFEGAPEVRYTLEHRSQEAPPSFTDGLRLGHEADVVSGCPLLVLGWPSPHGQRTIFVDSTHECISREGSMLRSRAFIHAGSSGGPVLTASLKVVGVISHNPRCSDDTTQPAERGGEEKYIAHFRSIERIGLVASPQGHALVGNRIPVVTPPAPALTQSSPQGPST